MATVRQRLRAGAVVTFALIIAALPFAVMILVYISSPSYIELLWTHPTGRMMMAGCAVWMSMGVFVMKKMINFDF